MFLRTFQIVVCTCVFIESYGVVLRGQPTEKELEDQIAAQESEVQRLQAQVDSATDSGAVTQSEEVVKKQSKPTRPQTEAEKLESLSKGLQSIHNLRAMFKSSKENSPHRDAEKFANGAMSEELSNQDSQVWSTIETMLGAVQQATKSMQGKKKSEQDQLMASLESQLNKKAGVLSHVTDSVEKKQKQQDEEYLLGLLIMHQKDWSMEQQLNATKTFMHDSVVLRDLYDHHDAGKPLAPQLAAMMDAETTEKPSKTISADSKTGKAPKVAARQHLNKAASAAAHLFIQLTDDFKH